MFTAPKQKARPGQHISHIHNTTNLLLSFERRHMNCHTRQNIYVGVKTIVIFSNGLHDEGLICVDQTQSFTKRLPATMRFPSFRHDSCSPGGTVYCACHPIPDPWQGAFLLWITFDLDLNTAATYSATVASCEVLRQ